MIDHVQQQDRAAIYARVSTEEQAKPDHLSLDTQTSGCHEYGGRKGYGVLGDPYIVKERHSGTDLRWEGTKLMWLVDQARRGAFDVLLCYNIDRFYRAGPEAFFEQMKYFEQVGVRVEFVLFDLPANMPYRRTLLTLVTEHHEQSVADTLERSMRNKREQAARHQIIPGGKAPYGHARAVKDGKKALVDDPETAPVLIAMYEHMAAGGTLGTLSAHFKEERILVPREHAKKRKAEAAGVEYEPPPHAYDWTDETIRTILLNPTNWGQRTSFNAQTVQRTDEERNSPVPGRSGRSHKTRHRLVPVPEDQRYVVDPTLVPGIISPELAARALHQLRQNRALAPRTKRPDEERLQQSLLFGGWVRCMVCGRGMRVKEEDPDRKTSRTVYLCQHRGTPYYRSVPQVRVNAESLDPFVWGEALYAMQDESYLRALAAKTQLVAGPVVRARALQAVLAEQDVQYKNLTKSLAKLDADDPDEADAHASIMADVTALARQRANNAKQLDALQGAVVREEQRQATLSGFRDWVHQQDTPPEDFSRVQMRRALKAMGTRVLVGPRNAKIKLRVIFDIRPLGAAAAALAGERYKDPDLWAIDLDYGFVDFSVDVVGAQGNEELRTLAEIDVANPHTIWKDDDEAASWQQGEDPDERATMESGGESECNAESVTSRSARSSAAACTARSIQST